MLLLPFYVIVSGNLTQLFAMFCFRSRFFVLPILCIFALTTIRAFYQGQQPGDKTFNLKTASQGLIALNCSLFNG